MKGYGKFKKKLTKWENRFTNFKMDGQPFGELDRYFFKKLIYIMFNNRRLTHPQILINHTTLTFITL